MPNKKSNYIISDVLVPNPPKGCSKRQFVLEGKRYCDITICAFKCINQCQSYFDHENQIKKDRKERKKEIKNG